MRTKFFTLFILTLLVLSSCGPQQGPQVEFTGSSQAWIDAPLAGSQLPLAAVEIVAHAASPDEIASFEINLNGQLLAKTGPDPASISQTLMYTRYTWQPAAPGSYLIEVKAFDRNNQPGSPAQVMVVIGPRETTTPSVTFTSNPTITSTSTLVPTPTLTPTVQAPIFTLTFDANCRAGPTIRHDVIISGLAGQSFPIVGKNEEGSWYFVQFKENVRCWFANSVGVSNGDLSPLPVFSGPPLPTDTPLMTTDTPFQPTLIPPPACSEHKDATSCRANTACVWIFTTAGPGYCKAK